MNCWKQKIRPSRLMNPVVLMLDEQRQLVGTATVELLDMGYHNEMRKPAQDLLIVMSLMTTLCAPES
jgi:hypothetical protein